MEIGEYDVRPPFLIYRNKDEVVRAILFYEDQACKDICNVLDRFVFFIFLGFIDIIFFNLILESNLLMHFCTFTHFTQDIECL